MQSSRLTPEAQAIDGRLADLAALTEAHEAQVAAEIDQHQILLRLCERYQQSDPHQFLCLAAERFLPGGHDGTPEVSEFLCLEVGAALGIPPDEAAVRIAVSLDLAHRFPQLNQHVIDGTIRLWQATMVVRLPGMSGLSADGAQWVDRHLAPALGRLPLKRILKLATGLIVKADPAAAAERAEQTRTGRRVSITHRPDMPLSEVWALIDGPEALQLDGMLGLLARHLGDQGDTDTMAVRRAKALGLLATPARALAILQDAPEYAEYRIDVPALPVKPSAALLPATTLVVHLAPEALDDPDGAVARCDQLSPVVVSQLKQLLSESRVIVRPVIDLADSMPTDSYEIPESLRFAVSQRTPYDAFPYGKQPAERCDYDHWIPYQHKGGPPGQTNGRNVTPLSRRPHRGKTAEVWQYRMAIPGVHHWTSPLGEKYVTGPEGTTHIDVSFLERRLELRLNHST
ncbi:DUF222 domain-containing protein [Aestuariimicrobium ganziense]|uniref:DUF222 domain-containing protein n=1 Tax=Aestuariimicrobium ganziense TaxID=2773677 RepID=UPI0019410B9D|nr:DUF222 domain-containing protein [Aestuariimicrobium ganziense]